MHVDISKRDQLLRELKRTATPQRKAQLPIERVDRSKTLPLSYAQQRLWFMDQWEGGGAAYHLHGAVRLRGALDRQALRLSLDTLLERHESLRTSFAQVNGEPTQVIAESAQFALQEFDLSGQEIEDREAEVKRHMAEESGGRFDLSTGPLIRGRLLRLAGEEHVLLITMHHIVSDAWSVGILLREIGALYAAYRQGQDNPLAPLAIQYADYAVWQRRWLQGQVLEEQINYWKQQLTGAPALLQLPTDRPRPMVQSHQGKSVPFALSAELSDQLKNLSRRHEVTLFMRLYAGLAIVLSRLSGQDDLVIGVPVANRQRAEVEGLIGFFVNMLALRVQLDAQSSVSALLSQVRALTLGGYGHQDLPFEQVVEVIQPPRSMSHSPIFQIGLSWQNTLQGEVGEQWLPGLTMTPLALPNMAAKFDLSWSLQEAGGRIIGDVHYASDLFDQTTIERWIEHFKMALAGMAQDAQQPVSALSMLGSAEREQVIHGFNATETAYPQDKVIHELFEWQARKTPEAVAVVDEDQQLTYEQLNRKSNQLAHYLRKRGVGPDQLVGLCVERSVEMIIGLLGILKAGGAYVPLDPSYPAERLEYMLKDAAPRMLLTQGALIEDRGSRVEDRGSQSSILHPPSSIFHPLSSILYSQSQVVRLDEDWGEIEKEEDGNLDPARLGLSSRHLAYVIYTSGSTGQPKGVMVEHCGVVNRLLWMQEAYDLQPYDVVLQKTPFSFDVSVWEFFWPLFNGAKLVLARPEGHRDPAYLADIVQQLKVTTLHFVPSMLQMFLEHAEQEKCSSLTRVISSGEALPRSLVEHFSERLGRASLYNLYGPTEAAVDVTAWSCAADAFQGAIPIGYPIANTRIYLLDGWGEPVPIGVAGEIHIGGVQVARGYLHRPDLTAERFIADPFAGQQSGRMYKTGDLGRYLPDGRIEYLGRSDFQVKIRGFRIELGEIEAQLTRHPAIREAVVLACESDLGDQRLVAYLTPVDPSSSNAPNAEELRKHLHAVLPEYMVPSAFVLLSALPLTVNGKLERAALPAPDLGAYTNREYEAPQGEVEEILAGIWQELLHVKRVGRRDNFFELGGHSLLIMRLLERLRHLGLSAAVRDVFEHPTLGALATALRGTEFERIEVPPCLIPAGCEVITPQMLTLIDLTQEQIDGIVSTVAGGVRNVQDIYPLAPLQEGILFHHLLGRQEDAYVLSTLLAVESRAQLDALLEALQVVIDRHDLLRSAVWWEGLPQPVQVVYRHAQLPVEELEWTAGEDAPEKLKARMASQRLWMDIRRAPLLRVQMARDAHSSQWYMLLQHHHLISDHIGQEILLRELMAHLAGRIEQLTEPAPYRDFVWQMLSQAHISEAEFFFRGKLGDVEEPTAPFGLLNVHGDGSEIEQADRRLEDALARRVRSTARRLGVSAATLFHAAWALVIARTSGRDDVVFGSVLSGRMQGGADVGRVMGMFINTLPLRIKLKDRGAEQLVKQVQREIVELLQYEQASLAVAQRCSGIGGSAPLFSTVLNYRYRASVDEPGSAEGNGASAESFGIRVLAFQERTNYPLTMPVTDLGEGFGLVAQTDRRIDPLRVVNYLSTALGSLVEALERAPESQVLTLAVLPESECHQVIHGFNATEAAYPQDKVIQELFEWQARKTPEAIAVVYEDQQLTYEQLNRKSNQLAHYLRKRGVGPDQLVGLCVDRSPEMIIGLLGILKAGGAYVPLDPSYPAERLEYMLEDAAPRMLLTQGALIEDRGSRIEDRGSRVEDRGSQSSTLHPPSSIFHPLSSILDSQSQVVRLDEDWGEIEKEEDGNLDPARLGLSSRHLAYVIYTSGSTGQPKGVAAAHFGLVNRVMAQNKIAAFSDDDICCHKTSVGFVDSIFEALGPLSNGRPLVIASDAAVKDAEQLASLIESEGITCLITVPSLARVLVESLRIDQRLATLRSWTLSGEALTADLLQKLQLKLPGCLFINLYGSSEVAADATYYVSKHFEGAVVPIGRPISNTWVYLLDGHGQPVPIGVSGEIYVGGAGVARGYLNKPQLTAERFLGDPFNSDAEARMYKTGDLGRWRPDGNIEYLGRNDDQVKIRGHRIELSEIEAHLMHHAQIKEAVVIAREDVPGEKRLVAYLTPTEEVGPSSEELRSYLMEILPQYMVPSAYVMVASLPLTPSGKVDRKGLPAPDATALAIRQCEAPQGEIEQTLAGIWGELLQVGQVGRHDNFFKLGGHSLLAVQLMIRIRDHYSIVMSVAEIFTFLTLKDLSQFIADALVDLKRYQTIEIGKSKVAYDQDLHEEVLL